MNLAKAIVGITISILIASIIFANGGPLGVKGNVGAGHLSLIQSDSIGIDEEILNIDLYKGYASVEVIYTMRNHGDSRDVKFGFPCLILKHEMGESEEIEDYQIRVNNEKVAFVKADFDARKTSFNEVKIQSGFTDEIQSPDVGWYISEIKFKKNERKRVHIKYISRYQITGYSISESAYIDSSIFRYILTPGAYWHGPIKKGTVTINAVAVNPDRIKVYPENRFARNGSKYVWSFNDLNPAPLDNIKVDINDSYQTHWLYESNPKYGSRNLIKFEDEFYVRHTPDMIRASSTSPPGQTVNYDVKNLFDRKMDTAWVEGKEGNGIGESVNMSFENPVQVDRLGIAAGYHKTREIYYNNNRVAEAEVYINGSFFRRLTFPDEFVSYWEGPYAYDLIDVGMKVENLKLVITKVHPGRKYQDTCISHMILLQKIPNPVSFGSR